MKSKFVCALILLLSVSCDIPKTLVIKNKTNESILVFLASENKNLFFEDSISKVEIEPKMRRMVFYGFGGTWEKNDVKKFKAFLQKSKIILGNDSIDRSRIKVEKTGLRGSGLKVKIK